MADKNPKQTNQAPAARGGLEPIMAAEVMDVVFEKLHLPKELRGVENPKSQIANPKTEEEKREERFFAEGEGEEVVPGEENPNDESTKPERNPKPEKETENAEGAGESGLTVEEIGAEVASWQAEVERLEEELKGEGDKGQLTAELEEARKNLAGWETAKEGDGQDRGAGVETVETVKASLVKAETERAQLEERVRELEAKGEPGLSVQNVHPLFLAEKAEEVEKVDREFAEFERWALENFDGIEEKVDDAGKVVQRGYSKEQIRRRLAEVSEARKGLIPAAREAVQLRVQGEAAARRVYPELFDTKAPTGKAMQAILRRSPVLHAIFPGGSIYTIMRDALEGERLRLQREKGKVSGSRGNGVSGLKRFPSGGTGRPIAPRGGSGGAGVGGGPKKAVNGGISAKRFVEKGRTRGALVEMLRESNIPMGRV